MKKKVAITLLVGGMLNLMGCTHESEEAYKARVDKEDEAECLARGFEKDSQALKICKDMLLREREKQEMRDVKHQVDEMERLRRESQDRLF